MELVHTYIKSADLTAIADLIARDPGSIERKDERGFPPLVLAAYGGDLEVCMMLVDAGADVDARDAANNTALLGVAFKGYEEVAIYLLENGANVNACNSMLATPLSYAATFGHLSMVQLLIGHNADSNMKDQNGKNALDLARQHGKTEIETFLSDI